jgi:hypothetical protein
MKSFSRVFPAALPKFIDCGYLAFLGTFQWKRQTSGFFLRTYLTVCVCVCVHVQCTMYQENKPSEIPFTLEFL